MRITASWFRSPMWGIYRIQGRGVRSLPHPPRGSPLIVLLYLDLAGCGLPQKGPEPPAVLGPVKEWPANAMGVLNDIRRPSLTDPARGGRESPGGTEGWSSARGRTKG